MGQGAFAVVSPASRSAGGELRLMLSQSGASRMTFDEGGGVEHAVGSGTIQGLRGNGTLSYQKGPAIVGAVAGSTGGSDADGCARDGEERRRVSPECGNADGEAGEGTLAEADPKDPVMYQLGRLAGEVSVLRDAVGILQGAVVTLQGAVVTLQGAVVTLQKNMYSEIGSLRKEMHSEIGSLRDDLNRVAREAQEKQQSDFKFLIRLILVGICVPFYLSILGFLAHSIGLF